MNTSKKTLFLTQFSILLALEAIVCFTPLGSIPIGPMVATLAAIPVIVTAVLLGTKAGTAMGFFTGLFSFIVWTFIMPASPVAFVFTPVSTVGNVHGNFWSLVICFVPRILIGVVAGLSFHGFSRLTAKFKKGYIFAYMLSGILGSFTATILVLGGIYVFFGQSYATAIGKTVDLLLGILATTVVTNGVLEAVIAAIVTYAVCYPIQKHMKKLLS
ncbi:MAG TPA: ECF transporter S component [Oscillospiraceae bacterium]|nr:ECF transporter S component [Oscillospiraceae bacterium]